MNIENFISDAVRRSVEALYGPLDGEQLQIQNCLWTNTSTGFTSFFSSISII